MTIIGKFSLFLETVNYVLAKPMQMVFYRWPPLCKGDMMIQTKENWVDLAFRVGNGYPEFLLIDHRYKLEKKKKGTLENGSRINIQDLLYTLLLELSRVTWMHKGRLIHKRVFITFSAFLHSHLRKITVHTEICNSKVGCAISAILFFHYVGICAWR